MPELPELAKMAKGINKFSQGKSFTSITKAAISKNEEIIPPFTPFSLSASSRGKELLLQFSPISEEDKTLTNHNLLMTMGLGGFWRYNTAKKSKKEEPKYTLLTFQADDGTKMWHGDKLRFSKWKFTDGFSKNRSPDPVKEYNEFVDNIKKGFSKKSSLKTFQSPISEVLLNQKYFNGIGNYLRAEILLRANIHPQEKACNALLVTEPLNDENVKNILLPEPKDFDFHNSIILKLCKSLSQQMIDATFIGKRIEMKAYRSKNSSSFKDKNNRTVWFHESQQFVIQPVESEIMEKENHDNISISIEKTKKKRRRSARISKSDIPDTKRIKVE